MHIRGNIQKIIKFIMSTRGIEVDLVKIKSIQDMSMPYTQKKWEDSWVSWIIFSSSYLHLTDKCDPIFKLMKKHDSGEWDENCQKAFDQVKEYLSNPPILLPLIPKKSLILYLVIHERSMGCVLGQHDETEKKEQAIYYLNKKFTDY